MSGDGFALDVPLGVVAAVALGLALVAAIAAQVRAREGATPSRRRALVGLRVVTAALAWLVAIQPTWVRSRTEVRPGRLAVLFDASRSGLVPAGPGARRVDEARALAARWAASSPPDALDVATFGRALRPARLDGLGGRAPGASLEAREDGTALAEAIDAAVGEGDEVGAVVVVSDGADLEGGAIDAARALGVRVHAVALGAQVALRDDAVAEVRADPVGFLRRPMQVRATVRRLGREGGPIPVRLERDGESVAEVAVEVPRDGEATVELPLTPDRLGRALYRVSVPGSDDDVPENDGRAFVVRTVRDDLRVLLVAGQPSWDERFLREFLSRDPSCDLISFFILRNTTDMAMAEPEELALIPFPTDELFEEHLGSFDVVVFQNFDYGPYQMATYLPRIRDYVMRGGSFAMIGGPLSFSHAGYAETPIAEVLPVEVLPRGTPDEEAIRPDRFRAIVAPDAARHPVVALVPDPRANVEAWAALAPLEGLHVTSALRPGAQVLLAHPTERGADGAPRPVLVAGTAGRGRVLALMTDTSWRWGFTTAGAQGDASAHERFWDRAMRFLARDPSFEPARLTTDRERYGPGATVRVEGTLADARYVPLAGREVTLEVVGLDGAVASSTRLEADAEGHVEATLEAPEAPGGHRLVARVAGEVDALAEEVFVVEAAGDELADPRPRPALLRALAEASAGTFVGDPAEAPPLSAFDATRTRATGRSTARPFASPWALAALLLAFGAEWLARRRWGAR